MTRSRHQGGGSHSSLQLHVSASKKNQVEREWRKLHCEKLCDLFLSKYCSGDKCKDYEMVGAYGMYGGKRNGFGVLVGKLE